MYVSKLLEVEREKNRKYCVWNHGSAIKAKTSIFGVGESCVKLSSKVRNLGTIFDDTRFTVHVEMYTFVTS